MGLHTTTVENAVSPTTREMPCYPEFVLQKCPHIIFKLSYSAVT